MAGLIGGLNPFTGGGGGSVTSEVWGAPATPNSEDDEFDSTTLDSAWVWTPTESATAIDPYASFSTGGPRFELHTDRRRSWLTVQPEQTTNCYLVKPHDFSSDQFMYARLSSHLETGSTILNEAYLSLIASSDNNVGEEDAVYIDIIATGAANQITTRFQVGESSSFTFTDTQDRDNFVAGGFDRVGFQFTGSDIYAWYGGSNGQRILIGSDTPTFGNPLNRAGFRFNSNTSIPGSPLFGVDYIRFVPGNLFLP